MNWSPRKYRVRNDLEQALVKSLPSQSKDLLGSLWRELHPADIDHLKGKIERVFCDGK